MADKDIDITNNSNYQAQASNTLYGYSKNNNPQSEKTHPIADGLMKIIKQHFTEFNSNSKTN